MSAADVKKEEPKTPVADKPSGAGPSPSGGRGGGRGGAGGPMRGGRGGFQQRGGHGGHPYQRGGGRGGPGGPQRGRGRVFRLNIPVLFSKKAIVSHAF